MTKQTSKQKKHSSSRARSTKRVVKRTVMQSAMKRHTVKAKARTKQWFVPHVDNDFIPKLIRPWGITLVLLLVISVQLGYNLLQTGSVLGRVIDITPAGLLSDTNDERAKDGLPALSTNEKLQSAAEAKASDMLNNNYWSHNSPSGTTPWHWIDQTGYIYRDAGENLAKGFSTSSATVAAWMASPTHKANILKSSYDDVGFAIKTGMLQGKETTLVVALYADPIASTSSNVSADHANSSAVLQNVSESRQGVALSWVTRFGVALESLTPAAITALAMLFIASTVALTAWFYRSRLPKRLQNSWYRHNSALKASGMLAMSAIVVLLYGGGQI